MVGWGWLAGATKAFAANGAHGARYGLYCTWEMSRPEEEEAGSRREAKAKGESDVHELKS